VREGISRNLHLTLQHRCSGPIVGAALVWRFYFSHWKETPGHCCEDGIAFGTRQRSSNTIANFDERNHCNFRACFVGWRDFFKGVLRGRSRRRTRAYLVGSLVWASVSLSVGRPDTRSSGTRPRAAHRGTPILPIAGKRLGLGYAPIPLMDLSSWRAGWRAVRVLAIS